MKQTGPESSGRSPHADHPPSDPDRGRPQGGREVRQPAGKRIKISELDAEQSRRADSSSSTLVDPNIREVQEISGRTPSVLERGLFSRLVLFLVLVSAAVTIAWAWIHAQERTPEMPVLIAAKNLPAYHALTDSDVTLGLAPARGKTDYATFPVAGALTLRPIKKGQPVAGEDISSNVVQLLGNNVVVVGLSIPPSAALGGTLSGGDEIQFLLGGHLRARKNIDAVILSVIGPGAKSNHDTVVVALQKRVARRYGRLLAAGDFVMIASPRP